MKYERTIMISPSEAKYITRALQSTDLMGEGDTITHTVSFGNDMEMDIKICGARDEEPWTEAVLFQNGSEVGCSEPEDSFDGEWCLEDQGDSYAAHVVFIRNHCELEAIYRKATESERAQVKKCIDPQNKEYQDYLEKKMIYVINALLEAYPECAEELIAARFQSNYTTWRDESVRKPGTYRLEG